VLTEVEYKRLMGAVHGEIRDEAIIELLLQTGMRLSELSRLKMSDIELPAKIDREHTGAAHISGKGRKERVGLLGGPARRALADYLADGRPILLDRLPAGSAPPVEVFLNHLGGPLGVPRRGARDHRSLELSVAAVTDRPQRVHREHAAYPSGQCAGHPEAEVAAPREGAWVSRNQRVDDQGLVAVSPAARAGVAIATDRITARPRSLDLVID
jgi:hypothetical protein